MPGVACHHGASAPPCNRACELGTCRAFDGGERLPSENDIHEHVIPLEASWKHSKLPAFPAYPKAESALRE